MLFEEIDQAARRQGPKRSEASKQAILAATREELKEHGWRSFSADRLAKRAQASKQTIYRWWPSIATIAIEAALQEIETKPTGNEPLELEIAALVKPITDLIRRGGGAQLLRSAVLAAADDKDASERFREWQADNLRRPLRNLLSQAAAKGQIRHDWDIDLCLDLMVGPIWHRLIALRAPIPEDQAEKTAQFLVQSLAK